MTWDDITLHYIYTYITTYTLLLHTYNYIQSYIITYNYIPCNHTQIQTIAYHCITPHCISHHSPFHFIHRTCLNRRPMEPSVNPGGAVRWSRTVEPLGGAVRPMFAAQSRETSWGSSQSWMARASRETGGWLEVKFIELWRPQFSYSTTRLHIVEFAIAIDFQQGSKQLEQANQSVFSMPQKAPSRVS